MAHGTPLSSSTGFLSKIFAGRTIPPVGVFAPKIGTRTCPPFCMVGGKVVFTPSALTNPSPQFQGGPSRFTFTPKKPKLPVFSTGGTVVKGRPFQFQPGRTGRITVPPSALIPPGKILPIAQRINLAGNTIIESISPGTNVNFPNRLKNIEIGSAQATTGNTIVIAAIAIALLIFLNR